LAGDLVPWACISLAILAALSFDSSLSGIWLWPWLTSMLLLGLPHGACDHLVAARISQRFRTSRALAGFFLLYLAGACAVALLWFASPTAALGLFLTLTAWHWGSADALIFRDGAAGFVARSVSRGLLVVAAPVAFHPEASWSAFSRLLGVFDPSNAARMPPWLPGLTAGFLAGALVSGCLFVARDARQRRIRAAARESVEVGLLLALFYFVWPVTAVGVYFFAWHAWRHTLRTGALLDPEKAEDVRALLTAYHLRALPLTLASALALAALTLTVGWQGPRELVAAYLVLLSALTAPHAAVVIAWDRRSRPGGGVGPRPA
jgi:Brp/Blh family beta-carotene 15,15'-monooxygenase